MYLENPEDGLNLFGEFEPRKTITISPQDFRHNSDTRLRFGSSFEDVLKDNLKEYKQYVRPPLIGTRGVLKEMKKEAYEKKVKDENLNNAAEFLSKLYGVRNIDFLKGLIREKGSVEDVILSEKKGELKELNKLISKNSSGRQLYPFNIQPYPFNIQPYLLNRQPYPLNIQPYPPNIQPYPPNIQPYPPNIQPASTESLNRKHSEIISLLHKMLERENKPTKNSELFIKQLIKDTYKPNMPLYKHRNDISVLLSDYVTLMKQHRMKTDQVKNSLEKLSRFFSSSMRIPKDELKEFVQLTVPMIEKEPRFF